MESNHDFSDFYQHRTTVCVRSVRYVIFGLFCMINIQSKRQDEIRFIVLLEWRCLPDEIAKTKAMYYNKLGKIEVLHKQFIKLISNLGIIILTDKIIYIQKFNVTDILFYVSL